MALYAAYVLMVQVSSQLSPELRGWLISKSGTPIDAEGLADRTGGDASIFSRAIELLTNDRIGWLVLDTFSCAEMRRDAQGCAEMRVEGKGREWKGVGVGVGVTGSVNQVPPTPTPAPSASQGLRGKRSRQQVATVDRFLDGLVRRWPALADERGNWAAIGYRLTELPRPQANELSQAIMREAKRLSGTRSPPSVLQSFANDLLSGGNGAPLNDLAQSAPSGRLEKIA